MIHTWLNSYNMSSIDMLTLDLHPPKALGKFKRRPNPPRGGAVNMVSVHHYVTLFPRVDGATPTPVLTFKLLWEKVGFVG